MAKVTINGVTYEGNSVHVRNGKVIIDGLEQSSIEVKNNRVDLHIIEGAVGDIRADGSVYAQNVHGSVNAGGSVDCKDVGGDVDAGGSATCGDVKGNVDAGGSVRCGNVEGDVDAGGSVSRR